MSYGVLSVTIQLCLDREVTYIHAYGNDHQLRVEAHQWSVLFQAMGCNKSLLDYSKEVVVKAGVYNEDGDFGNAVPVFVDFDKPMDLRTWTPNERKRELTLGLEVE